MNTSDLKDSVLQNSPVSKSQPKIPTVPQAILRLKKKSPSFKITLFKPKVKEKANHAHSSSVDFMEIFREVACYQPTALDSPTNPKKINKMQPKASLPSSTGDSYSKILSSWRQKDDSPVVEPFLAVHNVFGKYQDNNIFSDTLTSFFVGAPDIKEIDNHNQSSSVPFYLEEKKTLAKSQTKSPVPNLKNFVAKSSQDLLIPLKQKSDKTDDTKANLKPYKIYTNYRRNNNYTVREYDQCVSKELIDMINSKEKSSIISSREIPASPVRRDNNNNKEPLRSASVPRASIPGKTQSVSKITVNAEWRSGLTKAKPKQEKNIGSISESVKEEQVYKHPVLNHLQTRRSWVKKRGHNNSTKKLLDNKNTYSWGQIVDRNTILRKYPLVLNIGKEKEEEDLHLFILKRRSVEGGKF